MGGPLAVLKVYVYSDGNKELGLQGQISIRICCVKSNFLSTF